MSYCVLSDVQSLFKTFTFSTSSTVTTDEINNDIIPQYDRYLNDRLGRYYQVPITGVNALATMKMIERWLVGAEAAERIWIGQSPSESPQSSVWRKLAEDYITNIIEGAVILTDASPTGETPEPVVSQISDMLSQNPDVTPAFFTAGKVF